MSRFIQTLKKKLDISKNFQNSGTKKSQHAEISPGSIPGFLNGLTNLGRFPPEQLFGKIIENCPKSVLQSLNFPEAPPEKTEIANTLVFHGFW